MAKKSVKYNPPKPSQDRMIIKIDPREVDSKVRKPLPPPSQTHRDKSKYRRKPKHPENPEN